MLGVELQAVRALCTSAQASASGLPISRVTSSANSSSRSRNSPAAVRRISARTVKSTGPRPLRGGPVQRGVDLLTGHHRIALQLGAGSGVHGDDV